MYELKGTKTNFMLYNQDIGYAKCCKCGSTLAQ